MKFKVGNLYKFKSGLSSMTTAFSKISNKPLQNKNSSILLLTEIQKNGRGRGKYVTFIFLYENELFLHSFSKDSEHGRKIDTGLIFEEVASET